MSSRNVSLPKGYKLNDYVIAKKLSSGGFSNVYLAYDKYNVPYAIKEYIPNSLNLRSKGDRISFSSANDKKRFMNGLKEFKYETEIVMNLKHKNIIEIINFFEANGTAYIVMPYEYGMTLSRYIYNMETPKEDEIYSIAEGIFRAVSLLHENNVVHLDLKPGNIWLRPNKEALILDFGTARDLSDKERSKRPPMYTPGYAAPEQHRDYFQPSRIGVWTDYYGLGATLYALLTKASPAPSPRLIEKGIRNNISVTRKNQFNDRALKIIEELMQLNWEDRKNISLNKIIEELNRMRSIKKLGLLIDDLY